MTARGQAGGQHEPRKPVGRILIVAPNWLGDSIMAQPLLSLLQTRSGAAIDVIAVPAVAPVFRRMPEVARVIEADFRHGALDLKARWKLGRSLRRNDAGQAQYAQSYVLPNSWKSALVPFFADIAVRVGYAGEARVGLIDVRHKNPKKGAAREPMAQFYARLAELPGKAHATLPGEVAPQLPGSASAASSASATAGGETASTSAVGASTPGKLPPGLTAPFLMADPLRVIAAKVNLGLKPLQSLVALCPGAEYGPAKRWPAEYFAEVASKLKARGHTPVVLGAQSDVPTGLTIEQLSNGAAINLAGKTSLDDAINLIAGSRAVITNDSGLMHIAAALGTPQLALFGSSSPEHTPPLSDAARVIYLKTACSPCFARECPLGHFKCMREMTPEMVLAQFDTLADLLTLSATP